MDRLHDWFLNEAPGPTTPTALFEEAISAGGRKPRTVADLNAPRFKAESDNWCKAGDAFSGLVSSVQLSTSSNTEDEVLVESLSRRGVADLSLEELGALLEAKQRLAVSDGSARGKEWGLFEPAADLGPPSDGGVAEPAERTAKETAEPAGAPVENSMLTILKQMQGDNTQMREDMAALKSGDRAAREDQHDGLVDDAKPTSEEAGLQKRLLTTVMTGGTSKSVC